MVGAVLVHDNKIIGEGYHRQYGEAHAEVNCLNAVSESNRHLVPQSTLYVSLEPCNHFGQTPPCTELIIKHKIPKVVVGCPDPFLPSPVDKYHASPGKGMERLQAAGIEVTTGVLDEACRQLNKRFLIFHQHHRSYIILKWAQSLDGSIAYQPGAINSKFVKEDPLPARTVIERLMITNDCTNRIVHKWRSEEMGILVGTHTAMADDPELSTRLWPGQHPVRMVIDLHRVLPSSLKLFDLKQPTIVFNYRQHSLPENISVRALRTPGLFYYRVTENENIVQQLVKAFYHLQIQSVLVEGGSYLLQSFIDAGIWDEARIITNESLVIEKAQGLSAPQLKDNYLEHTQKTGNDIIRFYNHAML